MEDRTTARFYTHTRLDVEQSVCHRVIRTRPVPNRLGSKETSLCLHAVKEAFLEVTQETLIMYMMRSDSFIKAAFTHTDTQDPWVSHSVLKRDPRLVLEPRQNRSEPGFVKINSVSKELNPDPPCVCSSKLKNLANVSNLDRTRGLDVTLIRIIMGSQRLRERHHVLHSRRTV